MLGEDKISDSLSRQESPRFWHWTKICLSLADIKSIGKYNKKNLSNRIHKIWDAGPLQRNAWCLIFHNSTKTSFILIINLSLSLSHHKIRKKYSKPHLSFINCLPIIKKKSIQKHEHPYLCNINIIHIGVVTTQKLHVCLSVA